MRQLRIRVGVAIGRARWGQTMIDFAYALPVLILLVMGVLDFSIAVVRSAQLVGAVQEGVSYARRSPTDTTNIRDHVKKEGPGLNLSDANISVTCFNGLTTSAISCASAAIGDSVRVQATYLYTPLTGRLVAIAGNPMSLTQSATSEIY